jgi:hypothetical protein
MSNRVLLEIHLEDYIWNNINEISNDNLFINKDFKYDRQYRIPCGIMDIIGIKHINHLARGFSKLDIQIIELKKDFINILAVQQCLNYLECIKANILKKKNKIDVHDIKIVLIGIDITYSAACMLKYIDFIDFYKYISYSSNKISFEKVNLKEYANNKTGFVDFLNF